MPMSKAQWDKLCASGYTKCPCSFESPYQMISPEYFQERLKLPGNVMEIVTLKSETSPRGEIRLAAISCHACGSVKLISAEIAGI